MSHIIQICVGKTRKEPGTQICSAKSISDGAVWYAVPGWINLDIIQVIGFCILVASKAFNKNILALKILLPSIFVKTDHLPYYLSEITFPKESSA
jgi:hypothetical protein